MKLGTLRVGGRDGTLVVVRRDLSVFTRATGIAATLQEALDDWVTVAPRLEALAQTLETGRAQEEPFDPQVFSAPLPRAYEWVDGSAFLNHAILVRKARGASVPESLYTEPLIYQGGSGVLLGPTDDIVVKNPDWGFDFEAEVFVILADTPMGITAESAASHIRLVGLVNDITLRNLVPAELAKGFGFFGSKPASAFSPVVLTPDELGAAWRDGRVHLPLVSRLNGHLIGHVDAAAEMHFSFFDLTSYIARTRSFTAGTLLGSGTVSHSDPSQGVSCLAEKRVREHLDRGQIETPFLAHGDLFEMEMLDSQGQNLFGTLRQRVVPG